MLNRTLSNLAGEEAKFDFVVHDWGSIIGLLYQNKYPNKIGKFITLGLLFNSLSNIFYDHDCFYQISEWFSVHTPLGQMLIILLYQCWFAFSYVLSQVINFHLGDLFFKLFFSLPFRSYFTPCPHDKLPRPMDEISVELCYPYYYLYRDAFVGVNLFQSLKFPSSSPVLFMVRILSYEYRTL